MLETAEDEEAALAANAVDLEASLQDADASPVVALVDRILLQAMSVGASDILSLIHILTLPTKA